MRQWIIGMAAWLFAFNLHAQEARTSVTLATTEGVLQAHYRLPAPVTRFVFAEQDSPQRRAGWLPADADWNFDGTEVSRNDGGEFSAFALVLNPDKRFFDRRYVAVEQVGDDGWSVFLNALLPNAAAIDLQFDLPQDAVVRLDGQTLVEPFTTSVVTGAEQRLVYLGPARHISAGAATVVAGEDVPQWLRNLLASQMNQVVGSLAMRLGMDLPIAPTLLVTYDTEALVFTTLAGEFLAPTPCNAVIPALAQVIELGALPVFP